MTVSQSSNITITLIAIIYATNEYSVGAKENLFIVTRANVM